MSDITQITNFQIVCFILSEYISAYLTHDPPQAPHRVCSLLTVVRDDNGRPTAGEDNLCGRVGHVLHASAVKQTWEVHGGHQNQTWCSRFEAPLTTVHCFYLWVCTPPVPPHLSDAAC